MTNTPYSAKPMATYKDIQRLTGLSLSTISKYFNGGGVRPANREAIRQASDELGFQINDFARSLRRGTSQTVGVLLPALDNAFHLAVIAGVERVLQAHGVGVVVCSSRPDDRAPGDAVDALRSKMVDGIIAVPSAHDVEALERAAHAGVPVVTVDRTFPGLDTDHVQLENRAAGAMVANHLVDHQHERIGMIGGTASTPSLIERRSGFVDALGARNVTIVENWFTESELTIDAGRRAMRLLLSRSERPSAIFTANYELTVGALIALNESGLSIPDDISLVGFDINDIARVTRPRITTVIQPMHLIAERAAEQMLVQMSGARSTAQEVITVDADLAVGSSVRSLAPAAARSTR